MLTAAGCSQPAENMLCFNNHAESEKNWKNPKMKL
jgi:hypothetical protein